MARKKHTDEWTTHSSPDADPVRKQRNKNLARRNWLICCVLFIGALGFLAYKSGIPQSSLALPNQVAAAKKLGLPFSAQDFEPERTGSPDAIAAARLMHNLGRNSAIVKSLNRLVANGDLEGLKNQLGKLGREIHATDVLANEPSSIQGPTDWDYVYDVTDTDDVNNCASLLFAQASLAIWEGRASDAVRYTRGLSHIIDYLSTKPDFLGYLISTSQLAHRASLINQIANHCPEVPISELQGLNAKPMEEPPGFYLRSFYYGGIAEIRNKSAYELRRYYANRETDRSKTSHSALVRDGMPGDILRRAIMNDYIEAWLPIYQAASTNDKDYEKLVFAMPVTLKAKHPWTYKIVQELIPQINTYPTWAKARQAQLEVVDIYLKCIEFRRKTHAWPKSLAEVGAPTHDPLGRAGYHYRLDGGNVIVYSVGRNGIDEGGLSGTRPAVNITDDIAASSTK